MDYVGISHYESRLLSTVFGRWISYIQQEQLYYVDTMTKANNHWKHKKYSQLLFHLEYNRKKSYKFEYNLRAADGLLVLVLLCRGLHALKRWRNRMMSVRISAPRIGNRYDIKNTEHALRRSLRFLINNVKQRKLLYFTTRGVPPARYKTLIETVRSSLEQWRRRVSNSRKYKDLNRSLTNVANISIMRFCLARLIRRRSNIIKRHNRDMTCSLMREQVILRCFFLKWLALMSRKRRAENKVERISESMRYRVLRLALCRLRNLILRRVVQDGMVNKYASAYHSSAKRRAIVRLLRNLKQRFLASKRRMRLNFHISSEWRFRRMSCALVSWQCITKRGSLERRRLNLSIFHHNQSRLSKIWIKLFRNLMIYSHNVTAAYRRGVFHFYQSRSHCALNQLRLYYGNATVSSKLNYKGLLFWKFWRLSEGLRRLSFNVIIRKNKRELLLKSQVSYCNRISNLACSKVVEMGSGSDILLSNNQLDSLWADNSLIGNLKFRQKKLAILNKTFQAWKFILPRRLAFLPRNVSPESTSLYEPLEKPIGLSGSMIKAEMHSIHSAVKTNTDISHDVSIDCYNPDTNSSVYLRTARNGAIPGSRDAPRIFAQSTAPHHTAGTRLKLTTIPSKARIAPRIPSALLNDDIEKIDIQKIVPLVDLDPIELSSLEDNFEQPKIAVRNESTENTPRQSKNLIEHNKSYCNVSGTHPQVPKMKQNREMLAREILEFLSEFRHLLPARVS